MSPLFGNAIDSLQCGMNSFHSGQPKLAILLVYQSIELFLKELLRRQNPILIYSNIDKLITDNANTVGLEQILIRLRNLGMPLNDEDATCVKDLQRRRNRIEHFDYAPDTDDRDTIGKALKFIMSLVTTHLNEALENHINLPLIAAIEKEVLDFKERLSQANYRLETWAKGEFADGIDSDDFEGTHDCPRCQQSTMVHNEKLGDYCFFCCSTLLISNCSTCSALYELQKEDCDLCPTCRCLQDFSQ